LLWAKEIKNPDIGPVLIAISAKPSANPNEKRKIKT